MATTVYVLALEGGKYYVGRTNDPQRRIEAHRTGRGAAWTRLHKPLPDVEQLIPAASAFEEDKVVKEYMLKYGIANVRGGVYSNIELTAEQTKLLNIELWGAEDRCIRCGRASHFVRNCYARTDINGNNLEEDQEDACERCGRANHDTQQCYARTEVNGAALGVDAATAPSPSEPPRPSFFAQLVSVFVNSITSS